HKHGTADTASFQLIGEVEDVNATRIVEPMVIDEQNMHRHLQALAAALQYVPDRPGQPRLEPHNKRGCYPCHRHESLYRAPRLAEAACGTSGGRLRPRLGRRRSRRWVLWVSLSAAAAPTRSMFRQNGVDL